MSSVQTTADVSQATFISTEIFLKHWLGHRHLTRRVIEAFPEDKLFTFSVGGMRPFAELALEMIHMTGPGMQGIVEKAWPTWEAVEKSMPLPKSKSELLKLWDASVDQVKKHWPQVQSRDLNEIVKMFGQWEGPIHWSLLYFVDNEIHHRGQGYVYLRALGIEPPPFWDRNF